MPNRLVRRASKTKIVGRRELRHRRADTQEELPPLGNLAPRVEGLSIPLHRWRGEERIHELDDLVSSFLAEPIAIGGRSRSKASREGLALGHLVLSGRHQLMRVSHSTSELSDLPRYGELD